jgi:hypothetical protein
MLMASGKPLPPESTFIPDEFEEPFEAENPQGLAERCAADAHGPALRLIEDPVLLSLVLVDSEERVL